MEVFDCSKYKIDKVKMLANKKGLCLPQKGTMKRNKLNSAKVEYFPDFIFGSGYLQVVAYGINKLKYNGDIQIQLIDLYKESCIKIKQTSYKPLSESTLWNILDVIKPSQQKYLAGLDDTIANTVNGFFILKKLASGFQLKQLEDLL